MERRGDETGLAQRIGATARRMENGPWPSSLNVNSRFSLSFSFFPLRRFLPPYVATSTSVSIRIRREVVADNVQYGDLGHPTFPLFLGIATVVCGVSFFVRLERGSRLYRVFQMMFQRELST